MGRIRVDTMSQVARRGYKVLVICRCGNRRLFSPTVLSIEHKVRTMDELHGRFRCRLCRQRPWDIQVSFGDM